MTKEYIDELKEISSCITLLDSQTLEVIKSLISEELTARRLLEKVKEW